MSVQAVRGAIQVEKNESAAIEAGARRLVAELMERNQLHEESLISIVFSQTADLDAGNPARGLRTDGFEATPLFCTAEPAYPESLPRMLRVLVTAHFSDDREDPPVPVYLEGARALRPDLGA